MKDDSVYLHHILECIRRVEDDKAKRDGAFVPSQTKRNSLSLE